MTIRVFLADDHPTFMRTLSLLLRGDGFEVVGTATDGDGAFEGCLATQPDVVLMDINMPGGGGLDATARLADAAPHVGVIMLTMFEDDDSLIAALKAGARGYVVKGARQDEIQRAIRTVHEGGAVLGPTVARRMRAVVAPATRSSGGATSFSELTAREREVLDALAAGLDNAGIARRLHLGQKTVRNYVSAIFTKLHVASRAEAIVRAREAGLGGGPDPTS